MSAICGWVGEADAALLDRMLAPVDYRGDRSDTTVLSGAALGYRWWSGRPGKSPGVHREGPHGVVVAGAFAPSVPSPASSLIGVVRDGLDSIDGAFAGAWWDGDRSILTLVRDPFGVRSLYYVEHGGVLYFASELKQLLAVSDLPIEVDPVALHKYLTFSFVPGEDVPIKGIKRLLPGTVATWQRGHMETRRYFTLQEAIDPALEDPRAARRFIQAECKAAVARRLYGETEVGLYLSGGLDSSAVALWLSQAGIKAKAFSLDFGEHSVEKEQAEEVARALGLDLSLLPMNGADLVPVFMDLVWKLDLPFGDAVTGPQYLLGRAAHAAGLTTVFNGEGGDQLFGGWTNKPMIAAELYGGLFGRDTREERYLESYHKFYGLEDELYTPEFSHLAGGPGQRRAHLAPYLHSHGATTFLNRIRLADISLKGSQNILPRAERLSNCWGLDLRVPLFDRALATASFRLPPAMKLQGAIEKYVLKLILKKHLPHDIVWRRKFGMSVPVTDWVLSEMGPVIDDLLGAGALSKRGYFRPEYVEQLRQGHSEPNETRRRRLGERLWALAMLEAWLRIFVDGRGRAPA